MNIMETAQSKSALYKAIVVLTWPLWMSALVLGAICGTIVAGFLGGFIFMTRD